MLIETLLFLGIKYFHDIQLNESKIVKELTHDFNLVQQDIQSKIV